MQGINYEEIQKIEIDTTNKLLEYMDNHLEIQDLINNMEFGYPYFYDDNNRAAFNIWLSSDYITQEGQTFIDMFLKDGPDSLTSIEKEILIKRKNSYVSLFEILDYEKEYMIVNDVLKNIEYTLYEPQLYKAIKEGEFILARIGSIFGHSNFIGDISYLPLSARPMFMDQILTELNLIRKFNPALTINDYLKEYSLNLFKIYNDSIMNTIEIGEDITSFLYDELDEFEGYLSNKKDSPAIKAHISNLIDFFEYYLAHEDMTLYDLDMLDLEYFFKTAIKDGFISSQESLNSYINTLKIYAEFLNKIDPQYKETFMELLDISKNRFSYMNKIKTSSIPFEINRGLATTSTMEINENALLFLMEYDRFILYTVDRPLELTAKSKYIKRNILLEINDILEINHCLRSNNPNQKDFPLIHLFYYISIELGILEKNKNYLTLTKKGTNYLRLKDEEKFALFFQYLWSSNFIKDVLNFDNISEIEVMKNQLMDLLLSLDVNRPYEVASIIPAFSNSDFFFQYYTYLEYLGMVNCNIYPNYELSITSFGKSILEYIYSIKNQTLESSIVDLESYRKSK